VGTGCGGDGGDGTGGSGLVGGFVGPGGGFCGMVIVHITTINIRARAFTTSGRR
jgi:hypothetical protein